jgi:hypothetical protein
MCGTEGQDRLAIYGMYGEKQIDFPIQKKWIKARYIQNV